MLAHLVRISVGMAIVSEVLWFRSFFVNGPFVCSCHFGEICVDVFSIGEVIFNIRGVEVGFSVESVLAEVCFVCKL